MSDTIHVIGHKSPDTDTVMSAIIAADFLNKRDNTSIYKPCITANVNTETAFVSMQFNVVLPTILTDATAKKIFLVDHNEQSQIVDGEGDIVGIIDHHKMKFENANPIEIITKPWGCACTILYDLYQKAEIAIPTELKGPMLCAILSDTVILKSPTTTPKDIEVVKALAQEVEADYKELGMNMFKAKAQVASKSPMEIIKNDFKDFDISGKKVGIGQLETPDLAELDTKMLDIIGEMKALEELESYDALVLMLTDIIEEGTKLIVVSRTNKDAIEAMFETVITDNISTFIPGMMSRKKQVAPVLTNNL